MAGGLGTLSGTCSRQASGPQTSCPGRRAWDLLTAGEEGWLCLSQQPLRSGREGCRAPPSGESARPPLELHASGFLQDKILAAFSLRFLFHFIKGPPIAVLSEWHGLRCGSLRETQLSEGPCPSLLSAAGSVAHPLVSQ